MTSILARGRVSIVIGVALVLASAVCIALGLYPMDAVGALAARVAPILLFVVAITVVAELAAEAGVFDVVAGAAARLGRGRLPALWMLVAVVAIACTVFLSLDTTAVLLTPVVVVLARRVGADPVPFAFLVVWVAVTASLLLPVSNLTNLLAVQQMGLDALGFAAAVWPAALVAALVPVALLSLVFHRSLRGGYRVAATPAAQDRVLLVANGVVVALLLPALVSGIPYWIPALVAALVQLGFAAVRSREVLRLSLVPWPLLVFCTGLFLALGALTALGLASVLMPLAGEGSGPLDLLRLAGAGAVAANVSNNLPAYLALEPATGDTVRHLALLVGVNAGAIVTPWASLAALLWRDGLTRLGVAIGWGRFASLGLLAAFVTVPVATLALALPR